jgi:hypothetical protein
VLVEEEDISAVSVHLSRSCPPWLKCLRYVAGVMAGAMAGMLRRRGANAARMKAAKRDGDSRSRARVDFLGGAELGGEAIEEGGALML